MSRCPDREEVAEVRVSPEEEDPQCLPPVHRFRQQQLCVDGDSGRNNGHGGWGVSTHHFDPGTDSTATAVVTGIRRLRS